ncbi:MAG: hypothetical protein JSS69_14350 [Acidobacteria bacterium]|nr:hypothetical protein [Acidobacteriota bacterium]MBS1867092.1 hypothetical protein [Acidobacteriota bacterium]
MIAMAHFAVLAVTTIFAAAAAVLLDWLFLQAMFRLMRPAGAKKTQTFRSELVNGTRELAHAFGPAAVRR